MAEYTAGIDEKGIQKIKDALTAYIGVVNQNNDLQSKVSVDVQKAIKGIGAEAALKEMNEKVKTTLNTYITKVQKQFETTLDIVISQYRTDDTSGDSTTVFKEASTKISNLKS